MSWLFKPDCVDLLWYLATKLSIQRPQYLSTELDDESDPGALITSYRILYSTPVLFLGSLKTTFSFYSNVSTTPTWIEWFLSGLVLSLCVNLNFAQVKSKEPIAKLCNPAIRLYLLGLYEKNSVGLLSSFFRKDRSLSSASLVKLGLSSFH